MVLLSGKAGIGKSRLTAELLERLTDEPHTCLRYFCSPHHVGSALYPIIGQMERAAGFVHGDSSRAKLDKLDALLAQTSTQDAALFAEMLSLSNYDRSLSWPNCCRSRQAAATHRYTLARRNARRGRFTSSWLRSKDWPCGSRC